MTCKKEMCTVGKTLQFLVNFILTITFYFQFHTQLNLFSNNFESYYKANPVLGNMDLKTNIKSNTAWRIGHI